MTSFSKLSVANKIRLIITFSSGLALILTASFLGYLEVQTTKDSMQQRIKVIADLVSANSVAALTFEDNEAATRLLRSMDHEKSIKLAAIYDLNNELFAVHGLRIEEAKNIDGLLKSNSAQSFLTPKELHHQTSIFFNGEVLGTLHIIASLQPIYDLLLIYFSTVAVVLLVVITIVYFFSDYMHRRVSEPLNHLLRGMKKVGDEKDYSLRIPHQDKDEIGDIVLGFNRMISSIEQRDLLISKKQSEIEHHALFDTLTGLANRRQINTLLEKQLTYVKRDGTCGAILFLDLDHFKTINDSLGHSTGDDLLVNVAGRIKTVIRESDTAARIGGDEFIILLTNLSQDKELAANNVLRIAEETRFQLTQPFSLSGRTLYTSPSIGICVFDRSDESSEQIIMKADMAMYRSKENGRNLVSFFSHDMQQLASKRLQIEQDLRGALERGGSEFELYYQPQVNQYGQIIGAEALLRWHHPSEGFMAPDSFIPIAETTGLISTLSNWVLNTACNQLASWQEKGLPINLSVNLSPNEFLHTSFTSNLTDIIRSSGIDSKALELEITERVLLRNTDDVVHIMHKLEQYGVKFSIDDFGTGYSSLRYLKQLPLHTLKIDKSFVRDILDDPNDAAIIQAVVSMARHLNLEVIAEGVEIEAQCTLLKKYGCLFYQGYYFGKPLSVDEFDAVYEANRTASEKLQSL